MIVNTMLMIVNSVIKNVDIMVRKDGKKLNIVEATIKFYVNYG